MATILLQAAGSAIGSYFGGPIGGYVGSALGAYAGGQIDAALFGPGPVRRQGRRLADIALLGSTEGAPIPAVFGRMRVAGQIIWATRFKETALTQESGGGKGFGGPSAVTTTYSYSISFAVGLCEGPAGRIGRIWADGKLLDLSNVTLRFYPGTDDQLPDPLIEDVEGEGNAPGFRGLCYAVFEDLALAPFGNRIPQLQFELIRAMTGGPDSLENRLRAVTLIPGAGEFVYATEPVSADDGRGGTTSENAHSSAGIADLAASLDDLAALAPNLESVSLVVGWFGNDLRAGVTSIRPGVEVDTKTTYPQEWRVNGVNREDAHVVSQVDGRPAFGGTPSDAAVVQAIAAIKARGWRVALYPFLFMDVPQGNTLSDPYTGVDGQPAYPWRGRITCTPAPGVAGSPDKTAAAATQVNAFFGSASPGNFTVAGGAVTWTGGSDWGWRRMVLHYAHLCALAGGVDAFLIGSEFEALTRVRASTTLYPAVQALKALAADVRSIVGGATKIGYAANWSEYANHQTGDAPGAVQFHLDPLWSDPAIDFVGIDNYMPLADWRDGTAHLDYDEAGPVSTHDRAYLAANIAGGEHYDWYYANETARAAQSRTPITDGTYGKPWVWRAKDVRGWWSNAHYDRIDGTESATPTGWVPEGKPIWFTELGCPAVDKGANQPNVFYDPKSSESAFPHFSNGYRDDLIQRRFLEAHHASWADVENNPVSGVYGAPMINTANTHVWTWDARPFPFFPSRADVWGDAGNYRLGHWLNGRLGAVPLAELVKAICARVPFTSLDVSGLSGLVTGYIVEQTMSARDALEPLALAYHFDAVESQGIIRFVPRGRGTAGMFGIDNLVLPDTEPALVLERTQDSDLPLVSRMVFIDGANDYSQSVAEAHRFDGSTRRVAESALPLVLDHGQAAGIGDRLLQDAWMARETARFALPPSELALDPADEIVLDIGGGGRRFRMLSLTDTHYRAAAASATDPSIYDAVPGPDRGVEAVAQAGIAGRALLAFLDLPLLGGNEIPHAPHVAAYASPWPGAVHVYRSATGANYTLDVSLERAAVMGELAFDFYGGQTGRWDKGNEAWVLLYSGAFLSRPEPDVLAGANRLAIENADGQWEVVQFRDAQLMAPGLWKLTMLLRGQAGTEAAIRDPVAAGARVVVLDGALEQLGLTLDSRTLPFSYRWGPAGRSIFDSAFQETGRTFTAAGLRPLSPVHVRASWLGTGDIVIRWKRRTRIGGDSWEQADVPLAEESERYELDILDGGSVVRTLAAEAPEAVYTLAMQTVDFSGQQYTVSVAVHQISALAGRGTARKTVLYY